jgi:hypothetical protein
MKPEHIRKEFPPELSTGFVITNTGKAIFALYKIPIGIKLLAIDSIK